MCLKMSRTPWLALVLGIYLELSIRHGICDDSQLTSSSYSKDGSKGDKDNSPQRHAHHSWKGWEDWLPSSTAETPQYEQRHNHDERQQYIPLSSAEQAKLKSRRNRTEKKILDQQQKVNPTRSTKNFTEKTGRISLQNEGNDSVVDLKSLRDTAKTLASSVMNHFMTSWPSFSSNYPESATMDSKMPRNNRAIYLDNLADRQDGPNHGKPERDAKRGVIDWLSRLIGVQGKTLGEFLREYQVHVLYDLAFTFFKWIFFLYAGLLIP